jgi:hypothetical protein
VDYYSIYPLALRCLYDSYLLYQFILTIKDVNFRRCNLSSFQIWHLNVLADLDASKYLVLSNRV